MQLINVSNNLLAGPFAVQFTGTTGSLATIDASHNALTGPIPASLNQVSGNGGWVTGVLLFCRAALKCTVVMFCPVVF